MPLAFSTEAAPIPVSMVIPDQLDDVVGGLSDMQAAWVNSNGFQAKSGQICLLPAPDGAVAHVLFGIGKPDRRRERFAVAKLAGALPEGDYGLSDAATDEDALGWLLAGYGFDRYGKSKGAKARLVAPLHLDGGRLEILANAAALTQDLINTPANDMGPADLEIAFRALAGEFGASVTSIVGDDLIDQNFPMIHAVGRSASVAPRLLDMTWGADDAPKITLVGKGVCFDTGGLNLKPGGSMGLMKKDMGGAATVMGLARMIMALNLPVRLRVLVPAVENSVSAGAFRPGDVLTSRAGLTVEINNTDAEGRLVLADALALADEESPEHIICMATLTGAARVALGPDLPPFYCDDDDWAAQLGSAATDVADPVWRMPFWAPYESMIEPQIADLDNAPAGGFAGSITAALFLRRFVKDAACFTHFDIFGWTPVAKPGRPKGGACQAARAVFAALERTYVP